jgi:hypothetical protein
VHTNFLSSFWPSNQGQSVTSGKKVCANLPVSAEYHFACHALIKASLAKLWKSLKDNSPTKMVPYNVTCRAGSLTSSFPTSPTWDEININFTPIPFWLQHSFACLIDTQKPTRMLVEKIDTQTCENNTFACEIHTFACRFLNIFLHAQFFRTLARVWIQHARVWLQHAECDFDTLECYFQSCDFSMEISSWCPRKG